MDDNELLLRHAERWASERGRKMDRDLVALALDLRATHDGLAANRWPSGSVRHLMLVRWPAHGPAGCPDVDVLVDSFDTFWRFLRTTGRMAGASAQPKDLLREARSAARQMPSACADESNFAPAKSILSFGREVGIDLDDVDDLDEANARMQQIVEAWNALPDDERHRRSGDLGNAGSRMGAALTDAASQMMATGSLPPDWQLPAPPGLDDEEHLFPSDPAESAPHFKKSEFFRKLRALADWVGTGREVTSIGVLRPAVAREAYQALGLWEWDREWMRAEGMDPGDDPQVEALLAQSRLNSWRSAGDCLALDRLWSAAVASRMIVVTSRKAIRGDWTAPTSEMGWVRQGLELLVDQVMNFDEGPVPDVLITVLLNLSDQVGGAHTVDELHEHWWDSQMNSIAAALPDNPRARRWSDGELDRCLALFDDWGLWTHRRHRLVGTPFGWDVALLLMAVMDGGPAEDDLPY